MRGLLDINVLIALTDEDHCFHDRAHAWYRDHREKGWASCPLTENGLIRIMSNPNYHPAIKRSVDVVSGMLESFVQGSNHAFWPDDISLRDPAMFDCGQILGSRQITDLYLLALATKHAGRLVTFDVNIRLSAVPAASTANLCIIP